MGRGPAQTLQPLRPALIPRHVRAVTFDIGGTLITPWPSVGYHYAKVAARHGWPGLDPSLVTARFVRAWRAHPNFGHSRAEWVEIVNATFSGIIEPGPSRALFAELYARFARPNAWRVFEDVRPALKALTKRGYRLGVVSNWDRRLGPLLRQLKLHDYFEAVVISCHAGAGKPESAIFEKAAARLRLPPEAILHVGDSPEMDVGGARGAGFEAVLLNRGSREKRRGEIRSLSELVQA